MTVFYKYGRNAVLFLICAFLAACSQTTTAVNTYGDAEFISRSTTSGITKTQRRKKLLAARKRAKVKSAAKKAAFLKNRAEKRKARQLKRSNRKAKRGRKTTKKLARFRKINKKKKNRKSLKQRTRKTKLSRKTKSRLKRNAKRRIKRVKKSTYAYVGGRSKGISKHAPWRCVPGRLKKVISQISRKYGRVVINSTHRSRRHNRRVGGKRRSYHLRCRAIDFRVRGRTRGLTRWLAHHPLVGGYKRYRSGYYHIDTGPRRTW